MLSYAVGEFGLRYAEARTLTLKEYLLKMHAQQRMERNEWHRTRVAVALLLSPHRKGNRQIIPQQLIPLPGDRAKSHTTPESFKQAYEQYLKPKEVIKVYN